MSSSSDIAQWLKELGTSDRSANDPWTISRRYSTTGEASPGITADLGASLSETGAEIQSHEQITRANTQGTGTSGGASQSSGSSLGSGFLHVLGDIFPLFGGIASLFGGGDTTPQAALTPFIAPPSIAFSGALPETGSAPSSLSYGEDGLPRGSSSVPEMTSNLASLAGNAFLPATGTGAIPTGADYTSALAPTASSGITSSVGIAAPTGSSSSAGTGQQIVVQVQAMDSQSFLDRSHDIAQAVRQAMLNSHPVNDVILEL